MLDLPSPPKASHSHRRRVVALTELTLLLVLLAVSALEYGVVTTRQPTVRVIFFMTIASPSLTGRSAPLTFGNS